MDEYDREKVDEMVLATTEMDKYSQWHKSG